MPYITGGKLEAESGGKCLERAYSKVTCAAWLGTMLWRVPGYRAATRLRTDSAAPFYSIKGLVPTDLTSPSLRFSQTTYLAIYLLLTCLSPAYCLREPDLATLLTCFDIRF
jgi:hypothetical protein